jgi:hypothetical protein
MLRDSPMHVDPPTSKRLRRLSPSINSTQRQLDFSSTDETASSSNEKFVLSLPTPAASFRRKCKCTQRKCSKCKLCLNLHCKTNACICDVELVMVLIFSSSLCLRLSSVWMFCFLHFAVRCCVCSVVI